MIENDIETKVECLFRTGTIVKITEHPRCGTEYKHPFIKKENLYWCTPVNLNLSNKEVLTDEYYNHWLKNWSLEFADSYNVNNQGGWIERNKLKVLS